jgi:hypothetical protein
VKYVYYYQTKDNENRTGEIRARSRMEAFALLRKKGIRPYRLVGDDPVNWRPWAAAALFLALSAALVVLLVQRRAADDRGACARRQLYGDPSLIAEGVFTDWAAHLSTPLDRYLAAYAQPGAFVPPPLLTSAEHAHLAADLSQPLTYAPDERMEVRQLKNILSGMRAEMRRFLAEGRSVGAYMEFLETRQREEQAYRDKARAHVERAPKSHLYQTWVGVNAALRARGLAPLEMPPALQGAVKDQR